MRDGPVPIFSIVYMVLRMIQASLRTVARAVALYLGYYLGFSLILPLMLAFNAWSPVPFWGCMLLLALVDFVRALFLLVLYPDEQVQHQASANEEGSSRVFGWETPQAPVALAWERSSFRTVIGANIGPLPRRKQFVRRQGWQPRRTMVRRWAHGR